MVSLFSRASNDSAKPVVKRSRADQRLMARAKKMLEARNEAEAFRIFSSLAPKGDAEAQWHVGKLYLSGDVVPYSLGDGAYWINLAAEQEFPPACLTLAHLYFKGLPKSLDLTKNYQTFVAGDAEESVPDYEKAKFWGEKAAASGDLNAQVFLGSLLRRQNQAQANKAEADEAALWLQRSIEGGSATGKLEYGRQLLEEAGCFRMSEDGKSAVNHTEIFTKGIRYLEEALEGGAAGAALLLGWLCLYGPVSFQDAEKGLELLEFAAEKGFSQAQYRLGLFYMRGDHGRSPDMVKAEKWLKRALKAKVAASGYALGQIYDVQSPEKKRDPVIAMRFYHEAALLDHAPAAMRLSSLLMEGVPERGIKPDVRKGAFWLSRASGLGNQEAQVAFGNLLLHGVPAEAAEKEVWRQGLAQEAERGHHESAYNLALSYLDGIGGEQSDSLARQWFEKIAENFPDAAYQYGKMLFEGRGGEKNIAQAEYFFSKASAGGHLEACLALAQMFLLIDGIKDHPRALRLYHQAAEAGSADAMFSLGAMYGGGHDVPMNRFKARQWFVAGAEKGNSLAQYMAGRYYARGLGGERDLDKACLWLSRSAAQGIKEAAAYLQELQSEFRFLTSET